MTVRRTQWTVQESRKVFFRIGGHIASTDRARLICTVVFGHFLVAVVLRVWFYLHESVRWSQSQVSTRKDDGPSEVAFLESSLRYENECSGSTSDISIYFVTQGCSMIFQAILECSRLEVIRNSCELRQTTSRNVRAQGNASDKLADPSWTVQNCDRFCTFLHNLLKEPAVLSVLSRASAVHPGFQGSRFPAHWHH